MAPKKSFALRIDPKLYEILEKWSADELRSVNAHMEFLLRDAVRRAGRLSKEEMKASRASETNKEG
ncbi:hypothetical protein [Desulforamulus ruminis]|uniref:Arc-like DNA binding domain-containing protein n=1 Tax=Desulforamulus ruminis (strain ATCC 23193 / DSM 2154 / NCIMB 8452 / DL) TaxID=696281 RepID=F6DS06_DESRL|nr:hypothetical protein Desru_2816 [Desulforamulus ruminis DSM 2154]